MASIDGKVVAGAGVIQFEKECTGNAGTAPQIRFRSVDTGLPNSGSPAMDGNILTVTFNLQPGSHFCGTQDYTADGKGYRLVFIVQRLSFDGIGKFHEARYSVVLN